MALLEKNLIIRKSAIPGAGNGLFTRILIPKGSRIVEYKGKICTWKEVDHDEGRNGYIYYVKRYHVIDARFHPKALARYANDAKGLSRVKGMNNNCEYTTDGLRVFIEAKKDIPAGSEILVGYGHEYWSVIRYNARIAEKQEAEEKLNGKPASVDKKGLNGRKKQNGAKELNGAKKLNGKHSGAAKRVNGSQALPAHSRKKPATV